MVLNVESILTIHQSELLCTQTAAEAPLPVSTRLITLSPLGIDTVAIGYDEPTNGVTVAVALATPVLTARVPEVAFHKLPSVAVPREPVVLALPAKLS
jgi:hypothetical protein